MATIATVKVVRKSGEYTCKAYDANGQRLPDADYYTSDKADADATALAMVYLNKTATVNTLRADGSLLCTMHGTVRKIDGRANQVCLALTHTVTANGEATLVNGLGWYGIREIKLA